MTVSVVRGQTVLQSKQPPNPCGLHHQWFVSCIICVFSGNQLGTLLCIIHIHGPKLRQEVRSKKSLPDTLRVTTAEGNGESHHARLLSKLPSPSDTHPIHLHFHGQGRSCDHLKRLEICPTTCPTRKRMRNNW